jgi:hypothetical protein
VELQKKLQIRVGSTVAVVAVPVEAHLDLPGEVARVDDPPSVHAARAKDWIQGGAG